MANSVTGNPWILDTPGVITTNLIRVKGVRWVAATTAGHTAIIKDRGGRVVWDSVAAGANNVEADDVNNPGPGGVDWDGLTLDTLASGHLSIELM